MQPDPGLLHWFLSKLVYMWQFVSVWTSELVRTRLLAKKKKKQNSEIDLRKVYSFSKNSNRINFRFLNQQTKSCLH